MKHRQRSHHRVRTEARGDAILVLFARVPERGRVKTRLVPELGEEGALALHRAFLCDSLELLHRASSRGAHRAVWFSEPWTPDPEVAALLGGVAVGAQEGENLGERMQSCLAALLAGGYRRVVILGTDTPSLPVDRIDEALARLVDRDIVLGPAEDGGYYLLGARTVAPEMFRGIAWGGPKVLSDTVAVLRILGMAPFLLPGWFDVDTPADLERLASQVAALEASGAPVPRRTAALLRSRRREPPPAPGPSGA